MSLGDNGLIDIEITVTKGNGQREYNLQNTTLRR